jgi:hypothetical protein
MQPCYGYNTRRKFFFCGPQKFLSPKQVLAHMASSRERRITAKDKVERLKKEVIMWKQKAAKKEEELQFACAQNPFMLKGRLRLD